MSVYRFSSGKCFQWDDIPYQIYRILPGGNINVEAIFTGTMHTFSITDLVEAFFHGKLHFAQKDGDEVEPPKLAFQDIDDCPPNQRAIADLPPR